MKKIKFNKINRVIIFGGISLELIEELKRKSIEIIVYTAPRHAEEKTSDGKTLSEILGSNKIPLYITNDINEEPSLLNNITKNTLGLGFGEAWSFNEKIIDRFEGRLFDYMGIPHPAYRGGAHYTWMILARQRQGGCNIQVINKDMVQGVFDSGEIVESESFQYPDSFKTPSDFFVLSDKKMIQFVMKFIENINAEKNFTLKEIDESKSLYYPRLYTLNHGWMNWQWDGEQIARFIDAFDEPYKGASTRWNGKRIFIKQAKFIKGDINYHPFHSGLIVRNTPEEGVVIACLGGYIQTKHIFNEEGENITLNLPLGLRFYTPVADIEASMQYTANYNATGISASDNPINTERKVMPNEFINGTKIKLRLVSLNDCNDEYLSWLNDPDINKYLETRWTLQSIETIKDFVKNMLSDTSQYLFAIIEKNSLKHIGNIKLGPIHPIHSYADVSYFIGDKAYWGKGIASEAIGLVTKFGLEKLGLNRIQAGAYEGNVGSFKALEKNGYTLEGIFKKQLKYNDSWVDHYWFGLTKNDIRDNK